MCGIAGLINLDGRPAERSLLEAMIDIVRYRGPDESGVFVDRECGLSHVRLSIVDLAAGQQPMRSQDGNLTIVFNGEIFNHAELRQELEKRGRRFKTHCDTEVILHLYEEKGDACVADMNGQWAFAIWNARERTLFLSRDRMGVRPLFYTRKAGLFAFASEIKSLLVHPDVPRSIDPLALDSIFTIWTTVPPRTFFQGIEELPAGHSMLLRDKQLSVHRHFSLGYSIDEKASEEELAEELRARLIDATRLRFQSADVPVGAYLSGGLDSTVITSFVRRFTQAPLKTFSVTFEDGEFDESSYQRQAAEYLGVDHQQVLCRTEDIGRYFPDVIWHAEQPIVRTAPTPLFLLSRLVRENGFKVVLTGEGSDEMLGGYDIFKEAKVRRFWARHPDSRMRPLLLKRLYPYLQALQKQSPSVLQGFFHVRPEDVASPLFSHLPRWELTAANKLFFSPDVKAAVANESVYGAVEATLPAEYAQWDPFCQGQYLETRYLLAGYLLSSQGDRVAMANSIEGRYPFLDYRVVELASRIPPRLKMKVLNEKYLLKKAAGDLIPPFLHKRPKQPYRAPESQSFFDPATGRARFDYVEELMSEQRLKASGLFAPRPVQLLMQKARKGNATSIRDSMALVTILSAQLVFEQFIASLGKLSPARA